MYKKSYSRFRKPTKSYRRKPLVKKAIKKVSNLAFKKKVLKVLNSQSETKMAYHEKTWTDFNSSIAVPGDAMRIVPFVNEGTGEASRVGNRTRLKSLTLRGILQMIPQTNVNTYDNRKIAVRMMIVTPKSFPNWDQAGNNTATWMPYLLKKGATTTSFTGDVNDIYAPINSDAFITHYNKVFFLNQSGIFQTTAVGVASVDQSNLTRFWRKTFTFKNKLLKYDDTIGLGQTPSNWGPVLILGYALTDPSASPDTLTTRVRFNFSSCMKFEDV